MFFSPDFDSFQKLVRTGKCESEAVGICCWLDWLIDSTPSVMDNCFTVLARCLVKNTGDSVFQPLKNYSIRY